MIFAKSLDDITDSYRPLLQRSYLIFVAMISALVIHIWEQPNVMVGGGALAVLFACYACIGMWTSGKVKGLPFIPIIAVSEIASFVFPLVQNHDSLAYYSSGDILLCCVYELVFLGVLTATWSFYSKRVHVPARMLSLPLDAGSGRLLRGVCYVLLGTSVLYAVSIPAGWADDYLFSRLPSGALGIVRALVSMIGIVSIFLLALSHGQGFLTPLERLLYLILLISYMLATGVSFLLAALILPLAAHMAGTVLGSGRIPWVTIILMFMIINVLHLGKIDMRRQYWSILGGKWEAITPLDYPDVYSRWVSAGLSRIGPLDSGVTFSDSKEDDGSLAILDRASLLQMTLMAVTMAPNEVPYLYGKTYALVPQLLIPRIIWPDKPRTHAGMVLLNVHFGRQTMEDTLKTYIAWGMLAEAYANFGIFGPPILGLFLGWFYGSVSGATRKAPLGTLRALLSIVVLFFTFTVTQIVISIWVTSLFQAACAISIASYPLMRGIDFEAIESREVSS
jgi:hypothetical protein